MTRANQAVISKTCSGILVFLMQSGWRRVWVKVGGGGQKKKKWALRFWGLVACFLFICKQASDRELACPPRDDKRVAVEISSLGGKNEMF